MFHFRLHSLKKRSRLHFIAMRDATCSASSPLFIPLYVSLKYALTCVKLGEAILAGVQVSQHFVFMAWSWELAEGISERL